MCLISTVHCGEAHGERLGRGRYPNPGELSPCSGKLEVKFLCIAWLLLYALVKSISFSSVSWVSYHILVPTVYRLTKISVLLENITNYSSYSSDDSAPVLSVVQITSIGSVLCFLQPNCLQICVGFKCLGHEII